MTTRLGWSGRIGVAAVGVVGGVMLWTSSSTVIAQAPGAAAAKPAQTTGKAAATAPRPKSATASGPAARGGYLVKAMGCGDCHTPMKMGPNGPEQDETRLLSGHPADTTLPPPPAPSGPWRVSVADPGTAWSGPWGVSYTQNLTPDPETGLGTWTERQFMDALRTGRHQGRGRPILPPMPWEAIRNFSDADLKAIYAYLRTIPPIKNKVPDPVVAAPPSGQ